MVPLHVEVIRKKIEGNQKIGVFAVYFIACTIQFLVVEITQGKLTEVERNSTIALKVCPQNQRKWTNQNDFGGTMSVLFV